MQDEIGMGRGRMERVRSKNSKLIPAPPRGVGLKSHPTPTLPPL